MDGLRFTPTDMSIEVGRDSKTTTARLADEC